MKCEEARTYMLDEIEGTIAPDTKKQLSEHLDLCRDCRAEVELLRESRAALQENISKLDGGNVERSIPGIRSASAPSKLILIRQCLLAASLLVTAAAFLFNGGLPGLRRSKVAQTSPRTQQTAESQKMLIPVYITSENALGQTPKYSVVLPGSVHLSPAQWDELCKSARKVIEYSRSKPERPTDDFQKRSLAPVIPVSNQ